VDQKSQRLARPLLIVFGISIVIVIASLLLMRDASQPVTPPVELPNDYACASLLAAPLTEASLGGRVDFPPGGTVQVWVSYPLPEGADADKGAQAIWTTLDIAAGLPASCPFHLLDITVLSGDVLLHATVSQDDLQAWNQGILSDDELVERVSYSIDTPPAD